MTFAIAVIAVIGLTGTGIWYLLNSSQSLSTAPVPLTLGLQPIESSGLVYIAEDRHFFSKNGLSVTVRDYDPPAAGVRAMLSGELDLAGSTEYPVVLSAFTRENISILTKYVQVQSVSLIGRKDRGITVVSDLRKKKIGVTRGTLAEFYLSRFLTLHGISPGDITRVDVQPRQFAEAVESGGVDAIVCWPPSTDDITRRMGDAVVEWPANNDQPAYGLLVGREDWIVRNPDLTVRFLSSLDMAAEYTTSHPAESQAIVQKRLNLTDAYMASAWPGNHFGLSIDQSLVLAMEDEARWMIANNLTNATTVPDFRNYIYTEGLESVKPGSVNIIR
jgi:NitT/TauT family transport system substrate-binding protein